MRRPSRPLGMGIVLCALLSLVPACASNEAPPLKRIVVGLEANPTDLDPRHATGAAAVRIIPLLFNSLLATDAAGKVVPEAAESWEILSPTTYRFRLREGITFHDGRPLTAADVAYTYNYMRDPEKKSPALGTLSTIDTIETPDKATVVFRLKEPFASFLSNLTFGIVPAHLGESAHFMDAPVGSGPFLWKERKTGEKILLAAYDGYWEGRPFLDQVLFRIVENETTRLLEAEKGRIHLLWNNIPPYAVEKMKSVKGLSVRTRPGITYQYLGFNLEDPVLADVQVRRAIAHAINRDRIVDHLYSGHGRRATGLLAPEHWAFEGDVPVYDYDPGRARAMLDSAGFPEGAEGHRFTLTFKTSTNRQANETADLLAEDLEAAGIRIERRSFEWGTFYADIKSGNFQVYSLRWVGVIDPDTYHYIFHSESIPPTGANRGRYRNSVLDSLLDESRIELNEKKRRSIFGKIQRILAEDCVYVSLWHPDDIYALSTRFEGFEPLPGGQYTSLKKVRFSGP